MPSAPIYLDNHATTPLDPAVLDAMLPYLRDGWGNPSSRTHVYGKRAADAVEEARGAVAEALGVQPKGIVFTSGATEAINLALKGVAFAPWYARRGDHIVCAATEHKAVLDTCRWLEAQGKRLTVLPVDRAGRVTPAQLVAALEPGTVLVSLMHGNNEVGTLHPIEELARAVKAARPDVLFHVDAAQSFGKLPLALTDVDLLSLSAHKLYGPKGTGALYVRPRNPRVRLATQLHGGGQERGVRGGTLNVAGIVGLAEAVRQCAARPDESARVAALRDRLERGLCARLQEVTVNGDRARRLPGNLNVCIACVEGSQLMLEAPGVALSMGSACTSASLDPSYVIRALGVPAALAPTAVRFGVGRFNTEADIDLALERIVSAVQAIRGRSQAWTKRLQSAPESG